MVLLVQQVLKVKSVLQVKQVLRVKSVLQVKQVLKAQQVLKVKLALQVKQVLKAPYLAMKDKTDIGKVDITLTAWPEPKLYDTTKDSFELDGDPGVIATDILYFKTATDGYVRFEIPIHYKDDRTPSFIILTASASAYGAYFTGSTDSVLYIDDLRINY